MEEKKIESVAYIVHESMMARQERTIKRLWILCIIFFTAFAVSNIGWILYESQFEDIVISQDAETDPFSRIILNGTGTGDIYGTRSADSQDQGQENWQ